MFGRRRHVHVRDLKAGMRLLGHIRGYRGKVLIADGEVLSQKHVDQIREWEARPGEGRLSLYTRDVWVQASLGSGRERPLCDEDPYAALSIQRYYKRGMKIQPPRASLPSSTKTRYRVDGGKVVEVNGVIGR